MSGLEPGYSKHLGVIQARAQIPFCNQRVQNVLEFDLIMIRVGDSCRKDVQSNHLLVSADLTRI